MNDEQFFGAIVRFWRPIDHAEGLGPCQNCMRKPAVALHHIEPRSLAPGRIRDPWNVIPLCNKCHEWAAQAGRAGRVKLSKTVIEQVEAKWGSGDHIPWKKEHDND